MKTPHEIIIEINAPCHESWDAMSGNMERRFCMKCSKTVVDASLYSPEEIFSLYRQRQGDVCMRLNQDVLEKPLAIHKPNSFFKRAFHKAVLFVSFQFLFLHAVKAQVKNAMGEILKKDDPQKKYLRSAVIKGTVSDGQSGTMLYLVEVSAFRDSVLIAKAWSDTKGSFTLELKDSLPADARIDLIFRRREYEERKLQGFMVNKEEVTLDTILLKHEPIWIKEVEIARTRDDVRITRQYITVVLGGLNIRRGDNVPQLKQINAAPMIQDAKLLSNDIIKTEGTPEWFGEGQ
jgi:hypothetical protein